MNILIYIFIFISKIIENALSTLRVIVVANGKKIMGAILQFCIALIWILVTGTVVANLNKDPLKIIFFCTGSLVGSYIGSLLEEKMALGDSLVTCVTSDDILYKMLNLKGYHPIKLKGKKENAYKDILLITVSRKKKHHVINIIKEYDNKATIISEFVNLTK